MSKYFRWWFREIENFIAPSYRAVARSTLSPIQKYKLSSVYF
jgi:hypothetical protein